jgi:hypothetical protein
VFFVEGVAPAAFRRVVVAARIKAQASVTAIQISVREPRRRDAIDIWRFCKVAKNLSSSWELVKATDRLFPKPLSTERFTLFGGNL